MQIDNSKELFDARPENFYEQGHIPQAKNVSYKRLYRPEDNSLKTKEEIHAVFQECGIDLSKPVIASCGSGMTATAVLAAIEHYNIKDDVKFYDGSWTEYSAK